MHDEFRSSILRQGIDEEAYLKVTGKSEADLHADFRPDAEKRVKVLLDPIEGRRGRGRHDLRRRR